MIKKTAFNPFAGHTPRWTEDRLKTLVRMFAQGHTGTEIGKTLGCSRSAALGMIHRLRKKSKAYGVDVKGLTYRASEVKRQNSTGPKPKRIIVALEPPPDLQEPLTSFLQVLPSQCRYMYPTRNADGTGDVCGRPAKGSLAFCAGHAKLIYIPIKSRSETQTPPFTIKKKKFTPLPSFMAPVTPEEIS